MLCFTSLVRCKGIDIGYKCNDGTECHKGNGGTFSACNKWFGVCTCRINVNREGQTFLQTKMFFDCPKTSECRENEPGSCTDCVAQDQLKNRKGRDWYGPITVPPFGVQYLLDTPTPVCYEPNRAIKGAPKELYVAKSSIHGLGLFTSRYLPIGTVFGPYKGAIFRWSNRTSTSEWYTWEFHPDNKVNEHDRKWVDGEDPALASCQRYLNQPKGNDFENLRTVQYNGEVYFITVRSVHPGSELTLLYGDINRFEVIVKEINEIRRPFEQFTPAGHVNSRCQSHDNDLHDCVLDKNAMCYDLWCMCKAGSSIRAGTCVYDQTLGGLCPGQDGLSCRNATNAVCKRGVCVCMKGTVERNGSCTKLSTKDGTLKVDRQSLDGAPHEVFGCKDGICVCGENSTSFDGNCYKDEEYGGRCDQPDGTRCLGDKNTECYRGICHCKFRYSPKRWKCIEAAAGGNTDKDEQDCQGDRKSVV